MIAKPRIVCTIEARMTSSRLPGKVLLPAAGMPLFGHLVARLRRVSSIDRIVLATTINVADDPLVEYARSLGISVFRGSEEDVMERVIGAAESESADIVVEITADCPILDPALAEQAIQAFLQNPVDYVYNLERPGYPIGMDVQVFRLSTLQQCAALTQDHLDREHVSRYIRQHPERFRHLYLLPSPDEAWPGLGLTLDTREDYELLKRIVERFYPDLFFGCAQILKYLREEAPELVAINEGVARKGMDD